jgi:hypothetical protein
MQISWRVFQIHVEWSHNSFVTMSAQVIEPKPSTRLLSLHSSGIWMEILILLNNN